jgi:tRNA G18 (ribose-2'-O)-methylase SpoU
MLYVILDNVRSHYNVGAIFRTADAVGVRAIYLVGYTPTPIDRFGRVVPEIAKTSLGAAQTVSWHHVATAAEAILAVKAEGVQVVAIEQSDAAVSLYEMRITDSVALLFGNEVDGVSPETLQMVDVIAELPMYGMKESLNVSVTAGIALYEVRHHHHHA